MEGSKLKFTHYSVKMSNSISDMHSAFLAGPVADYDWCELGKEMIIEAMEELMECLGDVKKHQRKAVK